ncbi:MAG: shikimate kinase [bacterium]
MWTSFIGFMASGKSTVAFLMGRSSSLPVVDLDDAIARRAGCTVPEIFQQGGVERFRELEWQTLQELDTHGSCLLATGGGCVETAAVVDLLRSRGVVIWLDAPWETVRQRIEAAGVERRPMVGHLGWEGMHRLYLRRQRLYAGAAHFRIGTGRLEADSVARDVLLRSLSWQRRQQELS